MTTKLKTKAICFKQALTKSNVLKFVLIFCLLALIAVLFLPKTFAESLTIDIGTGEDGFEMGSLELLFLFAFLALAPSLLIMVTSFTRISIVLSFVRNAIGLQQTPPNQIIVGLALFLSLFIMAPIIEDINETAITPYMNDEITQEEALEAIQLPLKEFMLKQTEPEDLNLFLSLSGDTYAFDDFTTQNLLGIGIEVVIPAFITSELSRAFTIGFLLFLPFLVIDMIVASTLMSMGMVMLPPTMISLPFKIMLFVIADGWNLIMDMLVTSVYRLIN